MRTNSCIVEIKIIVNKILEKKEKQPTVCNKIVVFNVVLILMTPTKVMVR